MNQISDNDITECGREADLVAFIYGEASESATADFKRHIVSCAKCADEAAAFKSVRTDLAAWRECAPQRAGSFAALPFHEETSPAVPSSHSRTLSRPKRSLRQAQAALTEFFRVSPRWLQASGAFAALILCALVAFPLLDANERGDDAARAAFAAKEIGTPSAVPPASNATIALTQEELDNLVAREVARRLDERQPEEATAVEGAVTAAVARDSGVASRVPQRQANAAATSRATSPRAASATNRTQRTVADSSDDDDLPRLSDLLYGAD